MEPTLLDVLRLLLYSVSVFGCKCYYVLLEVNELWLRDVRAQVQWASEWAMSPLPWGWNPIASQCPD